MRSKSFFHRHQLPSGLLPQVSPGGGTNRWDDYFLRSEFVPLDVEPLDPHPTPSRKPLAAWLADERTPRVVVVVGTIGSGKTVEAVRAFRALEADAEKPGHSIPVWLGSPPTAANSFEGWVAAACGRSPRPSEQQVARWLRTFPLAGVVAFADVRGSKRGGDFIADAYTNYPKCRFVLLADQPREGEAVVWGQRPELSEALVCRVSRPDASGLPQWVKDHVYPHLDDDHHTPLVYNYLASLQPRATGPGSVADLYDGIIRRQVSLQATEPMPGGLWRVYHQGPELFASAVLGLAGVIALWQLVADHTPAAAPLLADLFENTHLSNWPQAVLALALRSSATVDFPPPLVPGHRGYDTCDLASVAVCGLFRTPDGNGGANDLRFDREWVRDHVLGRWVLPLFCNTPVGRRWVAAVARGHPDRVGPALTSLAGRLPRTDLLEVLGELLFGAGGGDSARAWLAVCLLRGRRWERAGGPGQKDALDRLLEQLQNRLFLAGRWPQLLVGLWNETVGRPDAGEWARPPVADRHRLARLTRPAVESAAPAAQPADGRDLVAARLTDGRALQVVTAGGWVFARDSDGRLAAWDPKRGRIVRFDEAAHEQSTPLVTAVAPLGSRGVAVGGRDGSVWVWRPSANVPAVHAFARPSPVSALAALPDHAGVLVGYEDGTVFRFDGPPPARPNPATVHPHPVRLLAARASGYRFVADHRRLYSSDTDALPFDPSLESSVTTLLAVGDHDLLGWRNGHVTSTSPEHPRVPPVGHTGAVDGLAVCDNVLHVAYANGDVRRVALEQEQTEGWGAGPAATGRLGWRDGHLMVGDRNGWVCLVPANEPHDPERGDRTITHLIAGKEQGNGPAWVFAARQNGEVTFDTVSGDALTRHSTYRLIDFIVQVDPTGDGGVFICTRRSGAEDVWFSCRLAEFRRVDRTLDDTRLPRGAADPSRGTVEDGVVAVLWAEPPPPNRPPTDALAACELDVAATRCARVDPDGGLWAVGLVTGELLLLRHTKPAGVL